MRSVNTNLQGAVQMWTRFNFADFEFGYTSDVKKEGDFLKITFHGQECSATTIIEIDRIRAWIDFLKRRKDTDDFVSSMYRKDIHIYDLVKGKDIIRLGLWGYRWQKNDLNFELSKENFKTFIAIMENALNKESNP